VGGTGVIVSVEVTVLVGAGTVFEGSNTDSGETIVSVGVQAARIKATNKTATQSFIFIGTCLFQNLRSARRRFKCDAGGFTCLPALCCALCWAAVWL